MSVQHVDVAAHADGAGCAVTGGADLSLDLSLSAGPATATQLDGLGRETVIAGKATVWNPVEVEGLGTRAVWLADPASGLSGELDVLMSGRLLRVTSSSSRTDADLHEKAIVVARSLGPDLIASDR
jgi:hypothetical protein